MENKNPDLQILVSIIVPVYNVEEYLSRCVDSLCTQRYKNLEIILVDDGSTDKSGDICDQYKIYDSRIKVIHQENGGLSEARNSGINVAQGQYLAFVDSDDFVNERYIDTLLNLAFMYDAEIAICDYCKGVGGEFPKKRNRRIQLIMAESMLQNWHGKYKRLETVAWNKLYKRELFVKSNICYPKGYYHEDVQTTHLLINEANKVVITNEKLYYYFQRKNSITGMGDIKSIEDSIYGQQRRCQWFKDNGYSCAFEKMYIKLMEFYIFYYATIDQKTYEQIGEWLIEQYIKSAADRFLIEEIDMWEKILIVFMGKKYKWIRNIVQIHFGNRRA